MSRKHFQAIAEAIKFMRAECRVEAAKAMADVCHQFSGRFDKGRFYTACGLRIDDSGKLVTCKTFAS